ncbi:two-component system, NtrC family, C4-dicarboxylate transport sensor histidine kinase DctB [Meinhardsimonia xiamenensis]|jgi:two-component system C4-dicarboxylate transport sensor histidine kinase DctB|uniref:C4-dicarboxylate transport sensor protein DctB n=1 Tax=Meinhardsimonia xiamenensis TaxID=990712 RepID=A0A1G9FZP4_9RHOB|nr:ATP-binding protein [Meinhardsimonia xiamenensis]PRX32739.1 two-component system C4-dicarboxylate transport sensor histidine kinase DctB [Meinhardsimonia xiamenensis]SDK93881.1 two-component system, NtrC family, C4-dicarboxylate transport sensor histidine kinase DctB [Meinhardsimonia xiamenensis]
MSAPRNPSGLSETTGVAAPDWLRRPLPWGGRIAVVLLVIVAVAVVWVTNRLLSERYTADTRARAEVRLALYVGNLMSELQRNSVVPLLLARDPLLIGALNSGDFTKSSQRLIEYGQEIGAASILLMDASGRIVAATDRSRLGMVHRNDPFFVSALRSNETVFTEERLESGAFRFTYSRRVESAGQLLGVVAVEANLRKFERSWAGTADAVAVLNSAGQVILSTEPRWRGLSEAEALAVQSAPSAIARAIRAATDWTATPAEAFYSGDALMRTTARIPFQGWQMIAFTSYGSVRARVNAVLAMEIMGFAMLLAGAFWLASRRALARQIFFQRETAELRRLNAALQREIAERERVEKSLQVAEQTIAQASKLAALGEMSAAVSHELNQPLAAMKTYLAGAKLLLQRRRPDEALSSFQRIDDLLERMGAITRQLKSYARKGAEAAEPVDLRECISSALTMMEPQLKRRRVEVTRAVPETPVIVMADRLRLEQVLINLLRNAVDATRDVAAPRIDIVLTAGEEAMISVRDNGHGIADLNALFEPFYTTKAPGDGVGLGLAISSSIVTDFGGRLTARNGTEGGAVFDVHLPLARVGAENGMKAAE